MVLIRYYKEIFSKEPFEGEYETVSQFLREYGFSRDELIDLTFFHGDILGKEIDTAEVSFLGISEGQISIFHRSQFPHGVDPITVAIVAVVAFVASFAAAVLLAPSVSATTDSTSTSTSTTNSLNDTNNEFNINGRIDDIFGTVNNHIPNLWQVPYRVGINDQEAEVLYLLVGRGKYDYELKNIRDNTTPYQNIPNAQVNVYGPGTWPGNGDPENTINGTIEDQPLGIYRESSDLNSTELLPPNDLSLGYTASWTISADGSTATLTLTNVDTLDITLEDYFLSGSTLTLLECWVATGDTVTLDRTDGLGDHDFATYEKISGDYTITEVTENTVTISGFGFTISSGTAISKETLYNAYNTITESVEFWTNDSEISIDDKYETSDGDPVNSTQSLILSPDIGQELDNVVGPFTLDENVTQAQVNLSSPNGFYKIDGTTYKSITASVTITVEETDSDGVATGNSVQTVVSYASHASNRTTSCYRSIRVDIPYTYSRIYARRTTNRDKGDGVSNVDTITWVYLYTFEPVPDDMDLGDVTTMQCIMVSNSQSRLIKSRKTNLDLTRKITQYLGDGEFGETEAYATDSFEQVLIHTALDKFNGRLDIENIDADTILALKDEIVDYFGSETMTSFGYDFDDNDLAYDDMYKNILDVANCIAFVQSGKYTAFFEKKQTESSMQITCRNKIPETETRDDIFEREYDGIELSYRSNDSGTSETIYVPSDGSASNPYSITLTGCTTELQAYRRAWREYNKLVYKTVNVSFDVDEFGRLITPGRRIDSPDGTRFVYHSGNTDGYRIYSGEVIEVNGLNIELSEPVQFTEGEDHYIQFTKLDGTNSALIQCTRGDDDFMVVLANAPEEELYDGYERDRTKFMFMSEQLQDSVALLPQTIEFKLNDGAEQNTVTSVNYSDNYYQNDLDEVS